MPQGNILTEAELKLLPNGSKVFVCYDHPNPDEPKINGICLVEQLHDNSGCYLNVGRAGTITFTTDFEYTGDDKAECIYSGDDGDTLEVFEWVKKRVAK